MKKFVGAIVWILSFIIILTWEGLPLYIAYHLVRLIDNDVELDSDWVYVSYLFIFFGSSLVAIILRGIYIDRLRMWRKRHKRFNKFYEYLCDCINSDRLI